MNVVNIEPNENKSECLKDKYMLTIKEAAFYFNIVLSGTLNAA